MPTLFLTVFFLQLTIYIINTIGASAINELLWNLYITLPLPGSRSSTNQDSTSTSGLLKQQGRLRGDVVRLKREMAATSAQDNFSKWAKLRREHDKAQKGYDDIAERTSSHKTKFMTYASGVRWVSINGLRLTIQFWYSRTAAFRLPPGWIPGVFAWLVGFPGLRNDQRVTNFEDRGTGVSVLVWGWVCVVVIGVFGDILKSAYEISRGTNGVKAGPADERTKIPMEAGGSGSRTSNRSKAG